MDNKNTGNVDPYGVVCAYACPSTEWHEKPFVLPEELQKGWNLPKMKTGPSYVVSEDMMIFYGVGTPEKRQKMIELFEKLRQDEKEDSIFPGV